jgi:hypothetical protein
MAGVYGQDKLESYMNETTPEERAELQTEYMKKSLMLSSEQEPKIHDLNLKYAKKMQDAYNTNDRKLQKLKTMKAVGSQKDQEIKSILNPEQYATYEKNKEEMKEKIRERAKEKRKGK